MNTPRVSSFATGVRQFAKRAQRSVAAVLLMTAILPSRASAQDDRFDIPGAQQTALTPKQRIRRSTLLKIVRDSTERFQDVNSAIYEGYDLQFGCVSGGSAGAMGFHFVNRELINAAVIDPTHPQMVIYESTSSGRLKLVGAEFLILRDQWSSDPKHTSPPELMGQRFDLFDVPNRFGLPAFYELHVAASQDDPNEVPVSWHPESSCEQFSGQVR